MSDLTVTASQIAALHATLSAVERLSPPPTPKGRYVLSRASERVVAEAALIEKATMGLVRLCATVDDQNEPILTPDGEGRVSFSLRPEKVVEYQDALGGLMAESVVLAGVRQITHAELGECPITVEQERVLIAAGLLEDCEPA